MIHSLDFDLHSQILMGLAEVLADSRAKATNSDIDRLLSKCPDVPLDTPQDDKTIFTRAQKPNLGLMVNRWKQRRNE